MKSQSVTTQMKAAEKYCNDAYIVLSKMVLTLESADQILQCEYSNESYTKQHFPVALFKITIPYKVALTFASIDKKLNSNINHSNESY